ncbi:hypothetical protein P43SY_007056 [Pythium insidiosum]|uniref:Carbohydrate-binding protein n=1 Tax=Pythium insidiosum TaxID=114742 RepID=A0AAD5LQJ4_PYTIN|nr:hypothetical protein P43SY_007056 [Pythium insidiosum]
MALVAAALASVIAVDAVDVTFHNECDRNMVLFDGKANQTRIVKGGHVTHQLLPGDIRSYRSGMGNQATLAEFSIKEDMSWFDISIIPTGVMKGPGRCSSLEDCKNVTGGTGFNVPMKIIPHGPEDLLSERCRTLICLEDGCLDAYHYPDHPGKTHCCPPEMKFSVIFCATNSSGEGSDGWEGTDESGLAPTNLTTAALTPAPPTGSPVFVTNGSASSDSSSAAVTVAAIMGGFVVLAVAAMLYRRYRSNRLAHFRGRRSSSLIFDMRDDAML